MIAAFGAVAFPTRTTRQVEVAESAADVSIVTLLAANVPIPSPAPAVAVAEA